MNKVISYHGYGLLRYDDYEDGAVLTHPDTNKSEAISSEQLKAVASFIPERK